MIMRIRLKIYKVNTNFDVELAEQYEVQANPTLILLKTDRRKTGNRSTETGRVKQLD